MKAIVCEMCGGNDIIKDQGFFVCQNCGTKYTVEEAKKMMVELSGNIDVSGSSVKIDDTGKLGNYLMLARNAFDNRNYAEAENYSNKVIEIDFENAQAWLLKGLTSCEQSTIQNNKFNEGVNHLNKSLDYANEDEKKTIQNDISTYIEGKCLKEVEMYSNFFANDLTSGSGVVVSKVIPSIVDSSKKLIVKGGGSVKNLKESILNTLTSIADRTWDNCRSLYRGTAHPDTNAFNTFIKKGDAAVSLDEYSMQFMGSDGERKKRTMEKIITMESLMINSVYFSLNANGAWVRAGSLPQQEKTSRRNKISEYKRQLSVLNAPARSEYTNPELQNKKSGLPVWLIVLLSLIAGPIAFCILVVIVVLIATFAFGISDGKTKNSESSNIEESVTEETSQSEMSSLDDASIELIAGEMGEYGRIVILSEGTDFEDENYCYFVPMGTYSIKNVGDYPVQVDVNKNEIATDVDAEGQEYEYWAEGTAYLIDVDEVVEITIDDGYFIEIEEPAHLELTLPD